MGLLNWFRRTPPMERRASASGFTAEVVAMRAAYISGSRGLAELTATVQACISLWEHGLSLASVTGTDMLGRRELALIGRSLALRGEALFLIDGDMLVPCSDWDLRTHGGRPSAYRLSISEAGGGTTQTALAAEVIHVRIGSDPAAPWLGSAPLRRSSLTASMLHAVESALAEAFESMPLGSAIVPFPETGETTLESLGRSFAGKRGRVLLRESVNVSAAGGPSPQADWKPADLSPDLSKSMTRETLAAARDSIAMAFGVSPGMFNPDLQGPASREHQRFLAQWCLQPLCELIAEEASQKLGSTVTLDCITPLQAFDQGATARSFAAIIGALAQAKEAGLSPGDVAAAARLLDWQRE
jgi:hypothetical protein